MKKKQAGFRKVLTMFLTVFLCAGLLAGCQGAPDGVRTAAVPKEADEDVEPLKEHNEVPADGIVSAAQMATIAGQEGTYYFEGETEDGVAYQWAYDGRQIQNPVEQKLKVECSDDGLEKVQKAAGNAPCGLSVTLQDMELAASAELTLTLTEKWNADKVLFCTYEDGKIYQLSQGEISQVKEGKKKVSQISFSVTKASGTFYLVGGSTKGSGGQNEKSSAQSGNSAKTKSSSAGNGSSAGQQSAQNGAEPVYEEFDSGGGDAAGEDPVDGQLGEDQQQSSSGGGSDSQQQGGDSQEQSHTCTISIECGTILDRWDDLKPSKAEFVPSDGWILAPSQVTYTPGETVFDVLKRVCADAGIQMESRYTPMYGSYYIEGINQLYEFDCGSNSGWMYCVNSWYPNYGCSSYTVGDGDVIEWRYTCDLGSDVGNAYMGGEN